MQISKRTLPTVRGGLLNKDFVYVNAASTNVAATFAKARAAAVVRDKLLDAVSAAIFQGRRTGLTVRRAVTPVSSLYRA